MDLLAPSAKHRVVLCESREGWACIILLKNALEADFLAYGRRRQYIDLFSWLGHFQRQQWALLM